MPSFKSFNRRVMLQGLGAGVLGALAPDLVFSQSRKFFARHHLPLGVQLYSVGDLARQDFGGTLQQLAAAGYRTTELAGYFGRTPAEIRRLHDAAGLTCTGAHVKIESGSADEPGLEGDLEKLAEQMHVIGASYVIVPGFPIPSDVKLTPEPNEGYAFYARVSRAITPAHWHARAALLNKYAGFFRSKNLKLGYHNHSFEFTRMGERTGFQLLLEQTDPALVTFELDVGWAFAAGEDPAELLRAHPGRFQLIHLKDMRATYVAGQAAVPRTTEIGSGLLDWRAILAAAYQGGARHFFVEQEPPFDAPPMQSMAASAHYLVNLEP
jgi:sugar phosphate isomerase/epimerase